MPRTRGFTLIELMIVVSILGILATIAVPALSKYVRRAKGSEARVNIAKMYDGNVTFFHTQMESVQRGNVRLLSQGGRVGGAKAQCPPRDESDLHDARDGGYGGAMWGEELQPAVACSDYPTGKCVPGDSYPMQVWEALPFSGLGFMMEQAHYFRYSFKGTNYYVPPVGPGPPHGSCKFTAQAFGDLDGDTVMSTFERAGSCERIGCNAAGLYIDFEVE